MSRGRKRASRNPNRRWCIPPAILREPDERLEGWHVLREIDGDVGVRLWAALRDVTLWADAPPEARGKLFAPGAAGRRLEAIGQAGADAALEVPLVALAAVVDAPRTVRPGVVSLMCRHIAAWAEEHGAPGTAVTFAQAAALSCPLDADAACEVGRLAMAWGRADRAETWLRRAIGIARRVRDLDVSARAYAAMGTLLAARGERQTARRHFLKALKAARRGGVTYVRGVALHGLFRLALDAGEWQEAERFSRMALRARGSARTPLPALHLDVARLHLARGEPQGAAAGLRKLLARRLGEVDRAAALAMLARACALASDERGYEEATNAAWTAATAAPPAQHAAALLDLARAAAARADWLWLDQALRLLPVQVLDAAGRRTAESLAQTLATARGRDRDDAAR